MNKIEQIDEYADETEQPLLLLGGDDKEEFEPAIIGIAHRFGGDCYVAYDYDMVIDVFAKQMSQEELDEDDDPFQMAVEHFEYNVIGGWLGEHTTIFIKRLESDN